MNQRRLVNAASLLLILLCFSPAIAQNQPSNPGSAKTENSQKVDEAKEKARKEEEARLEAEKRKQVEEKKHRDDEEAVRAKKESSRKEEERKAQERKEETKRTEDARKIEEDKRKEDTRRIEGDKRKEDDRRREEDRRKEDTRKIEEDKRKEDTRKIEEDKHKERDRKSEEERRKEEEVRLEVEKRRQVEREERRREREREWRVRPYPSDGGYYHHPEYQPIERETVVIITPQQVDSGPIVQTGPIADPAATAPAAPVTPAAAPATVPAAAPPATPAAVTAAVPVPAAPVVPASNYRYYRERETPRSYVSVLCAPGQGDRRTAVGLQYLSNKNYGIGAWFAGSLGQDGDVIDATIPHSDYYTQSSTGTYGIRALCCVGSDAAMLIFGAGISVDKTTRTDISNATGWKWNGGESTTTRPAAQIGCRFGVGGRVSLQLGYDTSHSGFFGLSASF